MQNLNHEGLAAGTPPPRLHFLLAAVERCDYTSAPQRDA